MYVTYHSRITTMVIITAMMIMIGIIAPTMVPVAPELLSLLPSGEGEVVEVLKVLEIAEVYELLEAIEILETVEVLEVILDTVEVIIIVKTSLTVEVL